MIARLPPDLAVECLELPGHGGAGKGRDGFVETAAAIAASGGRAVYGGYSMGGRICLRLALDHPDRVPALILFGASPGLADDADRAERRRSDEQLAEDIESVGVASFLEMWMVQPMFETSTPRPDDVEARRQNPPDGLAHALRELGTGAMEPLWDRLGELSMPTMLVVGEHDAKFGAIAESMAERIGGTCRLEVVSGAGHAAPLEEPEVCARLVADFVADHWSGP